MKSTYAALAMVSEEPKKDQNAPPTRETAPKTAVVVPPVDPNGTQALPSDVAAAERADQVPKASKESRPVFGDDQDRNVIGSTEHTSPIFATMDYTTTIAPAQRPSEWPFVRLYDGIVAQRDEALIVQRGDVAGKTPEQIRAFFCLSFTPRFICDASVPVGGVVTYGTLTNQAGDRVRIYLARTRLEFADERPLTLESITPTAVSVVPAPRQQPSKPIIPVQPALPEPVDPHVGFNIANAERHLRQFMAKDRPVAKIPNDVKIVGPDGFPYVRASLTLDTAGSDNSPEGENSLRANLVQSLLDEGFGLALWRAGEKEPVWVCKYRDILCLKLFNSLRPPPQFDETLYASTLDKALPAGSRIVTGHPSEQIFPAYARRVLIEKITAVAGSNIHIDPRLMEVPEVDTLRRFKLNVSPRDLDAATRDAIARQANWCLPYVVYF